MQFARHIAAFVVLQRHDPAQQASIVLAEAPERAREFVGFQRTLAYLRRPGRRNQVFVISHSHAREAITQILQGVRAPSGR